MIDLVMEASVDDGKTKILPGIHLYTSCKSQRPTLRSIRQPQSLSLLQCAVYIENVSDNINVIKQAYNFYQQADTEP